MPPKFLVCFSALIALLIAILSAQNLNLVKMTVFTGHIDVALGVISFISFSFGVLATISLWTVRTVKEKVSEQKQVEWQKQDEKLAREIQSDKEKQLLAKIETLEVALKAALDKKKKA